MIGTGDSI